MQAGHVERAFNLRLHKHLHFTKGAWEKKDIYYKTEPTDMKLL